MDGGVFYFEELDVKAELTIDSDEGDERLDCRS